MTNPEFNAAIFSRLGTDEYIAGGAAGGPWDEDHCHGGAPAALLATLLEAVPPRRPMALARFTFAFVRPVPLGKVLRVSTRKLHQGLKAQLVEAVLECDGVLLGTASAVMVRQQPGGDRAALLEPPDESRAVTMPGAFSQQFTMVPVLGSFGELGPAEAWFRLNRPLLEGAAHSAVAHAVAAADFGSGIANALPFASWMFPSLDLAVYLARAPIGDWTNLRSRWLGIGEGRTSCVTKLSDLGGEFGHAVQTILIEERAPDPA